MSKQQQIVEYNIPAVLNIIDNLKNYVRKAVRLNMYEMEDIAQINDDFKAIIEITKHLEKIQNLIKELQNKEHQNKEFQNQSPDPVTLPPPIPN